MQLCGGEIHSRYMIGFFFPSDKDLILKRHKTQESLTEQEKLA